MDGVPEELGEIRLKSNGERGVYYPFGPTTQKILSDSIHKQSLILLASGAKELVVGSTPAIKINSHRDLDKIDKMVIEAGGLQLAAPHPGGGCRMGSTPENSVVDNDHKVHGFDNLFVSGSSVFPTSSAVDPSLTIMAFSHIAADIIASNLGK